VNRIAETAVHASPLVQESNLNLGNLLWLLAFGWWLAALFYAVSLVLWLVPFGGRRYAPLIFGLGWYIMWPFGKYVEGCSDQANLRESLYVSGSPKLNWILDSGHREFLRGGKQRTCKLFDAA
jgi:uncharacterized membrane protein YccF (DUF307 family)